MRLQLLAALSGALLLSPAAAQPRQYEMAEIAGDLAYGFCPLFLAHQFPLDSPQLAERGFAPAISKQAHPRFGELQMVAATRADGEVAFGGVPGKICTIVVTGEKRDAALAKLREAMSWGGLDFKLTPHTGVSIPGVKVEAFKAPVDGQMLYLQLIEASAGPEPSVVAQMFGMAE